MSRDLIHGGALDEMRKLYPNAPEPWIDLSTGINPWPYPDITVSQNAFTCLPTQERYEACKSAMASSIGADPDQLILAPGSELLIRLLPTIIKPKRIAILSPTYGDHAAVWKGQGAHMIETSDPFAMINSVDAIIVTNPNNPDGRIFDPQLLEAARAALAHRGGWLIVDEAYADLMPDKTLASKGGTDGLIILRSFGKVFGLAGLRLGGMIAPSAVLNAMAGRLGTWPVSGAALEVGQRAYRDITWQNQTRDKLKQAAARLDLILKTAGLSILGGTDLFRYVETHDAYDLFNRLARAGIYVRRFGWSTMHLRIGLPQSPEAEARLRAALSPSGREEGPQQQTPPGHTRRQPPD
ncbi:MAG: threonine-phosphate decarboxylase CobD [Pseudomonadota bacterium]